MADRTRMPQVRTSLSKSRTHSIRLQSWTDYFLNVLHMDIFVYLYVWLRQIAVDSYPPDNCFGGAVGIIVGAAIGIARGLAGTTLGVLIAVCILIGLVVGSDDDGKSTVAIGIAVLVGAVANMVGGSSSVAVVSTLIVIGIGILVFKEERFTTGISIGAIVCGLIVIISGLYLHVSGSVASLGVAIGISISTISHATKYSAVVGVGATVAGFIVCVATEIIEITASICVPMVIAWTGFLITFCSANAAATGVSIATAGITAHVIVVGTNVDIVFATFSTQASAASVYYLASYVTAFAITGPGGVVVSMVSSLLGAACSILPSAYFVSEYQFSSLFILGIVALCAAIYGNSVGVALAVATRRAHSYIFVAALSGTVAFLIGIAITYFSLPDSNDNQFIISNMFLIIVIGSSVYQNNEDFDVVISVSFVGYIHLLLFFLSIPNLLKVVLGICFIIALFGFSFNTIKRMNSKLENKWKKFKEQLTSVCSQTDLLSHVLSTVEQSFEAKIGLLYLLNDPAQHTDRLLKAGLITKPVNDAIIAHSNYKVSYGRLSLLFALECQLRNSGINSYELCSFLERYFSIEKKKLHEFQCWPDPITPSSNVTGCDRSIIASPEFEELFDKLAPVATNPIFLAFQLFWHGLISKETITEIFMSTELLELPWKEIKVTVLKDTEKLSSLISVLKSNPDTAGVAERFEGLKLHSALEIIAEESFDIKGDQEIIFDRRKEYGFKLQVPAGALCNKEGCVVRVRACLPRAVPVGLDLVSAIYELSTPGSDQHPLGPVNIEIEQCALVEGEDELQQLCFLLCKAESNSPSLLHFHPIKGNSGEFNQHSAYGKLMLTSFSWIAIANLLSSLRSWFSWSAPMMYCARVYIENESLVKKSVCFVLMRACTVDIQAVGMLYSSSKELFKIPEVCFSDNSDSITLDWEVPEGWNIYPAYVPARVKRILAERFNEHNPAECKLFVEAQSQEPQGVCSYKIILGGVDHPKAMYVSLSCSTESPAVGSSHGTYLYMGDQPTLGPEHLNQLYELVKAAKQKWRAIGTELGFEDEELREIPHTTALNDETDYFKELLRRWLDQAPPNHPFPHVKDLATALRAPAVGKERTAFHLEQSKHEFSE